MTHWCADYIGRPWVSGISDCWSFARTVWKERFHLEVEPLPVDPSDLRAALRVLSDEDRRAEWAEVACGCEGDAALMGRSQRPCHVGIWIAPDDCPGILHSVERTGVIFTPLNRLQTTGYRLLNLYRRQA